MKNLYVIPFVIIASLSALPVIAADNLPVRCTVTVEEPLSPFVSPYFNRTPVTVALKRAKRWSDNAEIVESFDQANAAGPGSAVFQVKVAGKEKALGVFVEIALENDRPVSLYAKVSSEVSVETATFRSAAMNVGFIPGKSGYNGASTPSALMEFDLGLQSNDKGSPRVTIMCSGT